MAVSINNYADFRIFCTAESLKYPPPKNQNLRGKVVALTTARVEVFPLPPGLLAVI